MCLKSAKSAVNSQCMKRKGFTLHCLLQACGKQFSLCSRMETRNDSMSMSHFCIISIKMGDGRYSYLCMNIVSLICIEDSSICTGIEISRSPLVIHEKGLFLVIKLLYLRRSSLHLSLSLRPFLSYFFSREGLGSLCLL